MFHLPPAALEETLTAEDLALYQALVELDGPWWGEREAAYLRQLCAVQAAAGGSRISAAEFAIEWRVGPADGDAANLLPPEEGLALFADRHGLTVQELPA